MLSASAATPREMSGGAAAVAARLRGSCSGRSARASDTATHRNDAAAAQCCARVRGVQVQVRVPGRQAARRTRR